MDVWVCKYIFSLADFIAVIKLFDSTCGQNIYLLINIINIFCNNTNE